MFISPLALLLGLSLAPLTVEYRPGPWLQESPALPEQPYAAVQTKFPVEYRFVRPLEPDPGVAELEQFQGQPTLVLYWRLDDPAGSARLKTTLDSLATRSAHLTILALERSSVDLEVYERELWNAGLLRTSSFFSREEAIPRRFQNPFQWMLLSHEGKVVASEPWTDDLTTMLPALDLALSAAHHPAEVSDKRLLEAWEDFRSGKWDRAYSAAARARDKARDRLAKKPTDAESLAISTHAGTLALEIEAEAARRGARCRLLAERQDFGQAKRLFTQLEQLRPKESKEIEYLLADLGKLFEAKGVREGLQAAERFQVLEPLVISDGVAPHRAELQAFLAKHPEGFCARRAKHWLELFPE